MMKSKKELLIIVGLIITSIIIALCLQFRVFSSGDTLMKKEAEEKYVTVTLTGEVKEEKKMQIPKGYTYGYVYLKNKAYLNEYSYMIDDLTKKITEDTIIVIKTYDLNAYEYQSSSEKIVISKASFSDLITIYGIGEKRANKIIEYRKTKRIESFDELKKLLGVSNEVMARIKEQAIL